jgi:diguanylate cyclase (GGDEF)-like protein/PAS domain S-box-containing protein
MKPLVVLEFVTLLLFGPHVATLVAIVNAIGQRLIDRARSQSAALLVADVVTSTAAIQAAGFVHQVLGGTTGHFAWPLQAAPIAAAALAYWLVTAVAVHVITPLVTTRSLNRSALAQILSSSPHYVIAIAIAAALAEAVAHRRWDLLLVAALPLYFLHEMWRGYLGRLEDDERRREVVDSLDEGLCVLDGAGRVMVWSDALERITGASRDRALGCALAAVVPAAARGELAKALQEAATDKAARTVDNVRVSATADARVLRVKIIPRAGTIALVWRDVSEYINTEQAFKRQAASFALAIEGASDGFWEWDLRGDEFQCSNKFRALLGVGSGDGFRPQEWFGRVHPDDVTALKEAFESHLSGATERLEHEHRIQVEDGSYQRFVCRGVAAKTASRKASRISGWLTPAATSAGAQDPVRSTASLDPLTGLATRVVFLDVVGQRLAESKERRGGPGFAVVFLDLDRFKIVNDSMGHLAGDELLVQVSRRLESCLREGDALARLGGDEFAVLLTSLTDFQQASAIAFRIQETLSAAFPISGREVFTTASIGIAWGAPHYENPEAIMRDADTAMYSAKSNGRARHELFDAEMNDRARERLAIESDLRRAATNGDFEVHYQPIVLLESGRCVGFESLIRWNRDGKPVSPATFIPMAEELGLVEPIGEWVLQQACKTLADWQERLGDAAPDYITVNVSGRQLMQPNFPRLVERAVEKAGIKNPSDLRLEITETALMENPNTVAGMLNELREFGVKIYLDDFGTGYCSLSYLHKLPVDVLKVDRSFVRGLGQADRPQIVESILALARTINARVVAEGIETEIQARELERLGCTHAQGFLFSRPLPLAAAEEMLKARLPLGPKNPAREPAVA